MKRCKSLFERITVNAFYSKEFNQYFYGYFRCYLFLECVGSKETKQLKNQLQMLQE